MQHILTPHARVLEPFVWWEGAFTEQELNMLQGKAKDAASPALVGLGNGGGVDPSIRRSDVAWLHNTQDTQWDFEKLAQVISSLNTQYYGFDLSGFGEPLQLTNYDHTSNGMYGWHQDYGASVSRKLSMVVQLTDPADYEGGNLQVLTTGQAQTVRKQRGLIAVFPSYVLHQVTPVTQGNRQSLVAWVSGPAFK